MKNRMDVPEVYEPVLPEKVKAHIAKKKEEASQVSHLAKILVLSFVGDYPETATELHKQIHEGLEASATLDEVQGHLTALVADHFIASAEKPDGTTIYWR